MTIREIRELSGLSQSNFAAYYGIPLRTLQHWESKAENPSDKRKCPDYVNRLLEKAVRIDFPAQEKAHD